MFTPPSPPLPFLLWTNVCFYLSLRIRWAMATCGCDHLSVFKVHAGRTDLEWWTSCLSESRVWKCPCPYYFVGGPHSPHDVMCPKETQWLVFILDMLNNFYQNIDALLWRANIVFWLPGTKWVPYSKEAQRTAEGQQKQDSRQGQSKSMLSAVLLGFVFFTLHDFSNSQHASWADNERPCQDRQAQLHNEAAHGVRCPIFSCKHFPFLTPPPPILLVEYFNSS